MDKGFNKLKSGIFIEERLNSQDLELLLKSNKTKTLTITRLKRDGLEFLSELKNIENLRLYSCTFNDYSTIHYLNKLKDLFINGVKTDTDNFSFLNKLESLEKLGIGYATSFTAFPDLSDCINLKAVNVFSCKGLTDISMVTTIPNLEQFEIVDTPQMPENLEFIMQKPTMKYMAGAFGSKKLDNEFASLLVKHNLQYG